MPGESGTFRQREGVKMYRGGGAVVLLGGVGWAGRFACGLRLLER